MSKIKYTATHEWIEIVDSEGTVGITERAQSERGDIVFVELPLVGGEHEQGETIGRVETADGDAFLVHAPATGEITAVNSALGSNPDLINYSPEGDGWLCRISIESLRELDILMNARQYDEYKEEALDDDYMDEEDFYDDDEDY